MNPYIADILAQPVALRQGVARYSPQVLEKLGARIDRGDFDRILMTGMGSSYNAAYPAVIQLCKQAIPVQHLNTAELLYDLSGMLGSRSLLWMNSQSGESAELVHLVENLETRPPACSLAFINNVSSPLAMAADISIPIHAGPEATVSTKTYVNMLATNLLAAVQLAGGEVSTLSSELLVAAAAMENYLAGWERHRDELNRLAGEFDQLFLLGRGSSMSAVWNGSLINKEAAKRAFEGSHAADFRHGPLELVRAGFLALIFAGSAQTAELNRQLALEIIQHGGRAIWIATRPDPELPTLLLPDTGDLSRPLIEILPMQLLSLAMAERQGLQAGHFRYVSKVTGRE